MLAFLYWITYRANRRRACLVRQHYSHFTEQGLKRGGFWLGFLWTWTAVIAVHVLTFLVYGFAEMSPYPEQICAVVSLAWPSLVPAHVLLHDLDGGVHSLIRSTSIR